MDPIVLALLVTIGAGLATGLGSLLAFIRKDPSDKFIAFMLGLSAGVMIYVSLVEIFQKAVGSLTEALGSDSQGYLWATAGFFGGFIIIAIIDYVIDFYHNRELPKSDAETAKMEDSPLEQTAKEVERRGFMRMGVFMALAIAIHNFPEGLATFIAMVEEPALGLALALAIAIHNIPEGIAVSIPVLKATGSRIKAFWYSFASGLAEPLGAIIGFFLLKELFDDLFFGVVFAGVAGVMVYVALDQLLPTAKRHDQHLPIIGVFVGMVVMASSLVLFVI